MAIRTMLPNNVTISVSCDWSVAIFTKSLESQESYLTLRNLTLQITRDFFRPHSTFARLYNAAASPALRLRSAGSLAINTIILLTSHLFKQMVTDCTYHIDDTWTILWQFNVKKEYSPELKSTGIFIGHNIILVLCNIFFSSCHMKCGSAMKPKGIRFIQ